MVRWLPVARKGPLSTFQTVAPLRFSGFEIITNRKAGVSSISF